MDLIPDGGGHFIGGDVSVAGAGSLAQVMNTVGLQVRNDHLNHRIPNLSLDVLKASCGNFFFKAGPD